MFGCKLPKCDIHSDGASSHFLKTNSARSNQLSLFSSMDRLSSRVRQNAISLKTHRRSNGGGPNLIVFPDLMEGVLARQINPSFLFPHVLVWNQAGRQGRRVPGQPSGPSRHCLSRFTYSYRPASWPNRSIPSLARFRLESEATLITGSFIH